MSDYLRYDAAMRTQKAKNLTSDLIDPSDSSLVEDLMRELLVWTEKEAFDKRPLYGLVLVMCDSLDMSERTATEHAEMILKVYRPMVPVMDSNKGDPDVQALLIDAMICEFDQYGYQLKEAPTE